MSRRQHGRGFALPADRTEILEPETRSATTAESLSRQDQDKLQSAAPPVSPERVRPAITPRYSRRLCRRQTAPPPRPREPGRGLSAGTPRTPNRGQSQQRSP